LSIYELQAIPTFDIQIIRKILPFITLDNQPLEHRPLIQRIIEEENNFLLMRVKRTLEKSSGFKANEDSLAPFPGDRNKIYTRYRVSRFNDFSIGFTMEKDAGEEFDFDGSKKRYGPDYLSYHLMLENLGKFKSMLIGDYQIQLGQGLLLGAGFNPGKGAETITTVRRSSNGIRPYTSVLESGYFRGAAATYSLGQIDLTGFYSNFLQDGNIEIDSISGDEFVSSIQVSGNHRTPSELDNKDRVREEVIGTNLTYRSVRNDFQVGMTFINTKYDMPIFKKPNTYNQFEFDGARNNNVGAFGSYLWQNLNFFGEVAMSESGGLGMVGGMIASLSNQLAISIVLRNYHRDFHAFYGNAFGETTRNINERGIYWGAKITPSRKVILTAYYDKFSFPWLKIGVGVPSQGFEYLARLTILPAKNVLVYGQFRQEGKDRDIDSGSNLQLIEQGVKDNYLINLDYKPTSWVDLKSKVQWSRFNFLDLASHGFAIIQDLNFIIGKIKISTRFALFDTDNFDNRQFAYEKDVLYALSIPAYNGVGIRNYFLFQYKVNRKITFWLKVARTTRNDVESIGTGLTEINEDHKTDITFQTRYKF
jgi:hypothetical protein